MADPVDIPVKGCSSPTDSPKSPKLHIPSPLPTKRTRTVSACERALTGPTYHGTIKMFCRDKGHGFITPEDGAEPLFTHISDITGDFVPKAGDRVSYKMIPVPPKNDKYQAVHVTIDELAEGVTHETWDS